MSYLLKSVLWLCSVPVFLNFQGAQERSILRNRFHQPCSLAGLYDNPIPTQFPALIDSSKIPAPLQVHPLLIVNTYAVIG
jgi:hypothetical protein